MASSILDNYCGDFEARVESAINALYQSLQDCCDGGSSTPEDDDVINNFTRVGTTLTIETVSGSAFSVNIGPLLADSLVNAAFAGTEITFTANDGSTIVVDLATLAGGGFSVSDTNSIDLTVAASNLEADLIVDPDPTNLLSVSASGVLVQETTTTLVDGSNSLDYTNEAGVLASIGINYLASVAWNAGSEQLQFLRRDGTSANVNIPLPDASYEVGAGNGPDPIADLVTGYDGVDADGSQLFFYSPEPTLTVTTATYAGGLKFGFEINISSDAGNELTVGGDGGLYVPVSAFAPSTDSGNFLILGTDSLPFVPTPRDAVSGITDNADGTYTHDDGDGTTQDIVVVSGDADNALSAGSDNGAFLQTLDFNVERFDDSDYTAGVSTTLTLSTTPLAVLLVFRTNASNEQVLLLPGGGNDYTVLGDVITFSATLAASEHITVVYTS